MTDLAQLELDLINAIGAASTVVAIEEVRVAALGKTGTVSALLKGMGALSPDERREQGPIINGLRDRVSSALAARKAELEAAELDARLLAERVDLTLPSRPRRKGGVHPTMQVMDEMVAVFADMGFSVAEGPDIEDDFHNFTALNFPPKHPAREMHDTFFLKPDPQTGERKVLRTHTSPVQVRTMMSQTPPIRIIAPGRTFRHGEAHLGEDGHHLVHHLHGRVDPAPAARTGRQGQVDALGLKPRVHLGRLQLGLSGGDGRGDPVAQAVDDRPLFAPLIGAHRPHPLQQAGDRAGLAERGDAHLFQGGDAFGRADGVDQFEFECGEIGHCG